MGKKRTSQDHVQQSMGQLVSKAALAQMGPEIERMVFQYTQQAANQIAQQQASTLETMFARIVVLEQLAIEKGITQVELTERVADLQDRQEGLVKASKVETGDVVRLSVSTKRKDQENYQGTSKYRIYETGTGQSIGKEMEAALIGMEAGTEKEIEFGQDNLMMAKLSVDRISRAPKVVAEEVANADQAQG